jgi:lipopolysaccharide transport system permease protein
VAADRAGGVGALPGFATGLDLELSSDPVDVGRLYVCFFASVPVPLGGTLQNQGSLAFAVNLFAGLIVFNLFAECANRAPGLVLSHPNYVKMVVFPLEILASVALGSAAFHALTSLIILLVFELVAFQAIPASILWLPVI